VPRVYLLLHSNGDLWNSTVVGLLSMFATCGRFPWKAPTDCLAGQNEFLVNNSFDTKENDEYAPDYFHMSRLFRSR
jgi:hypothetical protein